MSDQVSYTLDLKLCSGNAMCVAMREDQDARKDPGFPDSEERLSIMVAEATGVCVHCGRPVR